MFIFTSLTYLTCSSLDTFKKKFKDQNYENICNLVRIAMYACIFITYLYLICCYDSQCYMSYTR